MICSSVNRFLFIRFSPGDRKYSQNLTIEVLELLRSAGLSETPIQRWRDNRVGEADFNKYGASALSSV